MTNNDARRYAQEVTAHSPSYRGNCPFCGGRGTFTATLEDGLLRYNCYKLGCVVKGVYQEGMTAAEIKTRLMEGISAADPDREPDTMEIPPQLVRPTTEHEKLHRFVRRWGLNTNDLFYDVGQERVVFPIYYKGRIIDAVGRAVGKREQPKWYRYSGAADYYLIGKGETLVLVEDVLSAMIATQEVPNLRAMAILGTSINDKHIEQIGEYDHVIVALDPDAQHKTLQFRREIELWTGVKATALRLKDDIKYRIDDDIESLRDLV